MNSGPNSFYISSSRIKANNFSSANDRHSYSKRSALAGRASKYEGPARWFMDRGRIHRNRISKPFLSSLSSLSSLFSDDGVRSILSSAIVVKRLWKRFENFSLCFSEASFTVLTSTLFSSAFSDFPIINWAGGARSLFW